MVIHKMSRIIKPFNSLERIFHEPSRMAIVSEVCSSADGVTFNQIKESCGLTDGNLSRHLKVLGEEDIVNIEKTFVDSKPRTTIYLTDNGREKFIAYLDALEKALRVASTAASGKQDLPRNLSPLLADNST